jgi:DNA-binding CsgD family transcriptional regulator
VLEARPAEAERELSFSALGDLLGPALDRVDALASPRRRALEVALLLAVDGETAPDPRAVRLATLDLLRLLAAEKPLLVAIDDTQWLDPPSQETLAYVLRRLDREPIALLTACRPRTDVLGEPERLVVGPLSLGALHELLRRRVSARLTRPTLVRVHETSGGNPFFALELARALEGQELRPGEPLSVPATLAELTAARFERLDRDARDVLLFVAALAHSTVEIVTAAAGGRAARALEAAAAAGLIEKDGSRVRFTHPLLASAHYGSASVDERARVHRRLAEVVTGAEERGRHLGATATSPDPAVAAALDEAAEAARARGVPTSAAELAERALALTPVGDAESRHRRTILAAHYRFESGDTDGPRRLLEELAVTSPPGPRRGRALADLARMHMFQGSRRRALVLLREALAEAEEPRLRASVEERLASTLTVLREDLREAWEHTRRSVQEAERLDDPGVLARGLTAVGFVGGVVGDPEAVPALERAIGLEEHAGYLFAAERPSFNLAAVLMYRGELGPARELFTLLYRETAEGGDEGSLAWTADNLANAEFLADDWDSALRWAREGGELAAQTGQPGQHAYAKATMALVHACRGNVEAARSAASEALELSGDEVAVGWMNGRWALGLLALSLGDAAEAHDVLDPACSHAERHGVGEPGTMRFVFDDIEALAALGRIEEAQRRLTFVEGHARRLGRVFALAAAARCRGLLAAAAGDRGTALEAFDAALAHEGPFGRARTLLALGATQRAAKRKREARATLGEALAAFERLGARIWAGRARDELGRISGRAPAHGGLTPTERRVAELVAEGLTNAEAAAALFVSPRTVEFHLRNIFRKLDVRTRAELARRFAAPVG